MKPIDMKEYFETYADDFEKWHARNSYYGSVANSFFQLHISMI